MWAVVVQAVVYVAPIVEEEAREGLVTAKGVGAAKAVVVREEG